MQRDDGLAAFVGEEEGAVFPIVLEKILGDHAWNDGVLEQGKVLLKVRIDVVMAVKLRNDIDDLCHEVIIAVYRGLFVCVIIVTSVILLLL